MNDSKSHPQPWIVGSPVDEPYVCWRFRYYVAHGGMTYRDIDIAVDRGDIKQGDMPNNAICVKPEKEPKP
jgi:hypothetical protein